MKVPVSWLKEFVEWDLPLEDLAHKLTLAGLEVEEISYVGLPMPKEDRIEYPGSAQREIRISGIEWDPEKIVTAAVLEVMPHPNADRLVLCQLDDGRLNSHNLNLERRTCIRTRGKDRFKSLSKLHMPEKGRVFMMDTNPGRS